MIHTLNVAFSFIFNSLRLIYLFIENVLHICANVQINTYIIFSLVRDINNNITLSIMDCMCDLWTRSPYKREDHCSGEIRRPASMAMWTI